jgi:glucokinase
MAAWGLVGDIGATNARFSLVAPDGSIEEPVVFASGLYPDIGDAIREFLEMRASIASPTSAVLAIAGAVQGGQAVMTNHPWRFSVDALRDRLRLQRLRVVNDFAANALAIPHLREEEFLQIGEGAPAPATPIAVLGPGTGLGMSLLMPAKGGFEAFPSEGGHVTMAASSPREAAVLEVVRERYGHASAERVLSGPGLVNLYEAIGHLDDAPRQALSPKEITETGATGTNPQAQEATAMFCAMLGTIAGNLALTLCAEGGVYIAGGIAPKLGERFARSQFRARFESKGRFETYLRRIPTFLITRPLPALLGAATLLDSE